MNDINIKILESQLINSGKQFSGNNKPSKSFKSVIEEMKDQEIKISKHASKRIEDREVVFNTNDIERINSAFNKAEEKGVKDALILMDDKILITNVKSRTVITTLSEENLKENVFTNIDGAVIA